MKKKISAILCLTIALMSTACSNKAEETTVTESTATETSVSETSETETTTTEAPVKHEPMKHEFQNCVYTQFYKENYGEETEKSFRSYCDAVLNGENKFYCPDETTLDKIYWIARDLLPVGAFLVQSTELNKNEQVAYIEYSLAHEEYMAKVEEFKTIVIEILDETCMSGFTDLEKALALYEYFHTHYTYDNTLQAHQPYGVFMDHTGICQDFASAYTYLLNLAGVEAFTCGSSTKAQTDAHEWAIANIDGKYYHIDPTWAIDSDSLRYFGMSDSRREAEGDWDMVYMSYGYNIFNKNDRYKIDDERFLPLADSIDYSIDYDNNIIEFTSEETNEKKTFNYGDMSDFVQATPVPSPVDLSGKEAAKINHQLEPHVYTKYFEETYTEDTKTAFFAFCDAALAYNEEFDCPDQETLDTILKTIAPELMPMVAFIDISKCSVADGKAHLEYALPENEYLQKINELKAAVTGILDEYCREGYNDFGNALSLYEYFASNVAWDYENDSHYDEASDGMTEALPLLTTYRALTEHLGSNDNISDAYVYLLAQVGVSAITAASTDIDAYDDGYDTINMTWTMLNLNGENYNTNLFFASNDPAKQLRYFCSITTDQYAAENLHLAGTKADPNKFKVNDSLGEVFGNCYDYEVNYTEGKVYIYTFDGNEILFDFNGEVQNVNQGQE